MCGLVALARTLRVLKDDLVVPGKVPAAQVSKKLIHEVSADHEERFALSAHFLIKVGPIPCKIKGHVPSALLLSKGTNVVAGGERKPSGPYTRKGPDGQLHFLMKGMPLS